MCIFSCQWLYFQGAITLRNKIKTEHNSIVFIGDNDIVEQYNIIIYLIEEKSLKRKKNLQEIQFYVSINCSLLSIIMLISHHIILKCTMVNGRVIKIYKSTTYFT